MNVWQKFPYSCQRMPAAPLRRLTRMNSEPSRQLARFAPRRRLRGSVHALPLSPILTTSDRPVHSPDGPCRADAMRVSPGQRDATVARNRLAASDEITTGVRIHCGQRMPAGSFVCLARTSPEPSWQDARFVPGRSFPGSVHAMPLSPRNATQSTCLTAVLSRHDTDFSWSAGMRRLSGNAWL